MSHANVKPSADETKLMMLTGHWVQQMISVIARIGLPDQLASGPRDVQDVARALGVNAEALFRIARALSKVGVLTVAGTRIGLTEAGSLLREDAPNSLKHVASFSGSPGPWKAWGELIRTLERPESTMKHAHGQDLWAYMADHPQEAAHFNRSMANISNAGMAAVMAHYDFSYAGRVCDVGGGAGSVLALLLQANPRQTGMVFDLPAVIEDARAIWRESPLARRCSLVAGDFFERVPPGADLYVLKNIVHNYDDANAARILGNCSAAMSEGSKLVLLESPLVEDGPTFSFLLDVHMMILLGGRERTPQEYGELLASSGLALTRIVPTGGLLTVIEARRAT